MGIDEDRFIEPIDDSFKCSICLGVFIDPVQVNKVQVEGGFLIFDLKDIAGHVACKECIIKWLRNHNNCPICRRPLKLSDLKPSIVKINQLSVYFNK
jgi:hypothetical protein